MCGITAEFGGEDLFEQVVLAMNKFELLEKLSGLTTDGAPAMVGPQKGLTALVKKEISRLSLDPSDLVVCHCIIHQESLCAHSMKLHNVNDNCHFRHKFYQKQTAKQPPVQGATE